MQNASNVLIVPNTQANDLDETQQNFPNLLDEKKLPIVKTASPKHLNNLSDSPKPVSNKTTFDDQMFADNMIEFKHFKEKKTNRTYIYNLDKHITDQKKLEKIIKDLKNKLATSCLEKKEPIGTIYGFQGDHATKIKEYFIEKKILQQSDFK
jgi:translation initiation factor 1 (eIF-1/SUI1)